MLNTNNCHFDLIRKTSSIVKVSEIKPVTDYKDKHEMKIKDKSEKEHMNDFSALVVSLTKQIKELESENVEL